MTIKKINNKTGFTLIEMIVALAVFIIVIAITVGIFTSILKAQRKTYNLQVTQDTARYLMEMMAKEIRMSDIINIVQSGPRYILLIDRLDTQGEIIEYVFSNDVVDSPYIAKRLLTVAGIPTEVRVLNDVNTVEVNGRFYKDSGNRRVTIVMEARSGGARPGEEAVVRLETSVISRCYSASCY